MLVGDNALLLGRLAARRDDFAFADLRESGSKGRVLDGFRTHERDMREGRGCSTLTSLLKWLTFMSVRFSFLGSPSCKERVRGARVGREGLLFCSG